MTLWFTADLHLGHENIIRYASRPFDSVEQMNCTLINRWNEVVGDDDEVWVLGDFALGKITETLPLASLLRGRKVLLTGNHDRCWPGHGRRAEGWTERYLDAGFAEVRHGMAKVDVGGKRVEVCHFPYRGAATDRHAEHRPIDYGNWLFHGHVHDRWQTRGRMINVGVDVWDYMPISLPILATQLLGVRTWDPSVCGILH